MEKQDWLAYFEAVNGRSPEQHEIEAARSAGEFVEEDVPAQSEEASIASEPVVENAEPVTTPEPASVQQQAQTQQEVHVAPTYQQTTTQSEQSNAQQVQYTQPQQAGQQFYAAPPAPSAFTVFIKQFWKWMLQSWKTPTTDVQTHKYNGAAAIGLISLLTTLTISIPLMKYNMMEFSGFLSILIAFVFIFVAFVLAGFVVKKFVYREEKFTLGYSFEWFGRLLSLNVLFMGVAVVSVLLNLSSLVIICTFLSYFIFAAASGYTLYHPQNHSSLDLFYKYIIASVIFGVIITLFFMLGTMIAGDLIFSNLFNNFNFNGYYPPFGY